MRFSVSSQTLNNFLTSGNTYYFLNLCCDFPFPFLVEIKDQLLLRSATMSILGSYEIQSPEGNVLAELNF